MEQELFENYLFDLGRLIRENALEAKKDKHAKGTDFELGRLMGYHEVVSLMQSQAMAFGIRYSDIGLEGIDPEVDLL